jgi:outer membrane protein TolC
MMHLSRKFLKILAFLLVLSALVSLCSCKPAFLGPFSRCNPFESVDHIQLTQEKAGTSVVDTRVKPATAVTGNRQLTVNDCKALAIANCPELQVDNLELLSKGYAAKSFRKRMLPHLVLSSELGQTEAPRWYYGEPNLWGSTSTIASGAYDLLRGKELRRYTAEVSWSPNDATQAYFLYDNTRKDQLITHYDKVRKTQQLLSIVEAAFFRLLSLQESIPNAAKVASLRLSMRDRMKELYDKRLIGLEQLTDAQNKLTRAQLTLTRMQSESERQRSLLAAKMGVSPNYTVDGGFCLEGVLTQPTLRQDMSHLAVWDMERTGLKQRPETYKSVLTYLKSVNDMKRTAMKYLPHVTGFCRYSRIEDRTRYDKDWKEVGVNVRADLLDLWANLDEARGAKLKSAGLDKSFDSVASQVISEVRFAALKYFDAQAMIASASESLSNAREFLQMAVRREGAGDLNRLAVEEARANLLDKTIEMSRALGEANATLTELHATMATNHQEPLPCP